MMKHDDSLHHGAARVRALHGQIPDPVLDNVTHVTEKRESDSEPRVKTVKILECSCCLVIHMFTVWKESVLTNAFKSASISLYQSKFYHNV